MNCLTGSEHTEHGGVLYKDSYLTPVVPVCVLQDLWTDK